MGVPSYRLRIGIEVAVSGTRVSVRIPDLVVLSEELAIAMDGATRSIVLMDMPSPLLVVEVLARTKKNEIIVTSGLNTLLGGLLNIGSSIQSSKK